MKTVNLSRVIDRPSWFLLASGAGDAGWNMALDEALLEAMPRLGRTVLRFYSWTQPAASFGYFQKYAEVERTTPLRPLVRRPTAGGVVPHQADWTYSLTFPTTHVWYGLSAMESYRRVHAWIQASFARLSVPAELAQQPCKSPLGQCFVGYEKSDLLWRGRKIAGAAQRRKREGLLIQGSVQPPALALQRADWEQAMRQTAPEGEDFNWATFEPDLPLRARARELLENKYSQENYLRRR